MNLSLVCLGVCLGVCWVFAGCLLSVKQKKADRLWLYSRFLFLSFFVVTGVPKKCAGVARITWLRFGCFNASFLICEAV